MKKLLFVLVLFATSCVPKSKYDSAEYEASYWEDMYNHLNEDYGALNRKHSQLINQYNELVNDYNQVYYQNSYNKDDADDYKAIIERTKDAVYHLKRHFQGYCDGWYTTDDIERDIKEVESKLDGWL